MILEVVALFEFVTDNGEEAVVLSVALVLDMGLVMDEGAGVRLAEAFMVFKLCIEGVEAMIDCPKQTPK